MSDDFEISSSFTGVVSLFPLPNVVLFPRVMLPLHIFEPRYRQMTADALAGDKLIAMALIKSGWEAEHEHRPPLNAVACLGRIMVDQRLEDGRYNILLRGLSRVRILHELEEEKLYRRARVELLSSGLEPELTKARALRKELDRFASTWFAAMGVLSPKKLGALLQKDLPLGALGDILTFALPLPVEFKQELLEQLDVEQRLRQLLGHLESNKPPVASEQTFPPSFSDN